MKWDKNSQLDFIFVSFIMVKNYVLHIFIIKANFFAHRILLEYFFSFKNRSLLYRPSRNASCNIS